MSTLQYTNPAGQTFDVIPVHKLGEEGSLLVDRRTGVIVSPLMEHPDWAEGLAVALLEEHRRWYTLRAGSYQEPDILEMSDLGWIGIDPETGDEAEIYASEDMRQERLAHLLHMDPETGDIAGALAEVEHAFDQARTSEEASAIEHSQEQDFGDVRKAASE